jgi:hypothetical protein
MDCNISEGVQLRQLQEFLSFKDFPWTHRINQYLSSHVVVSAVVDWLSKSPQCFVKYLASGDVKQFFKWDAEKLRGVIAVEVWAIFNGVNKRGVLR